MKKTYGIVILLFSCVQILHAQGNPDSTLKSPLSNYLVFKRHEILVESFSFSGKGIRTLGGMIRENYRSVSFRLRAAGGKEERSVSVGYIPKKISTWSIATGIQKNINLSRVGQFYWGGDINYTQRREIINDVNEVDSHNIGISPFAGIRFCIKKFLVIGAENGGYIGYQEWVSTSQSTREFKSTFGLLSWLDTRFLFGINF
jgi:hypothetical protein